jgi:hypothetical protein
MGHFWPSTTAVEKPSAVNQLEGAADRKGGPDFLCIGAQKSGTTWLYEKLHLHPDFWMPPRKELHYFDKLGRRKFTGPPRQQDKRDLQFLERLQRLSEQPFLDLEGYARLFACKGSLISGDITPAYSSLQEEIIARIVERFPELKVIFLARDPVERALSQLAMDLRQRHKPCNFGDAEDVIRKLLHPSVLLRSHPSAIAARWRRHVHPDQFQIYFFDELEKTPAALLGSIVRFLGADPAKMQPRRLGMKRNSNGKLKMPGEVIRRVARFFESELKACAAQLGGPAASWPARYGLSLVFFFLNVFDNVLDLIPRFDPVI